MPDIVYLSGASLNALSNWIEWIVANTSHEIHLLSQNPSSLEQAGRENRLIVAVDRQNNTIVGCIALWPLNVAIGGIQWFELGTVFVAPAYRHPQSGLDIADELHRQVIKLANGHNIMSTTTSSNERKAWQRVGLITIRFSDLPPEVLRATCVCPFYKIGVANPLGCPARDGSCVTAIARETMARLNLP